MKAIFFLCCLHREGREEGELLTLSMTSAVLCWSFSWGMTRSACFLFLEITCTVKGAHTNLSIPRRKNISQCGKESFYNNFQLVFPIETCISEQLLHSGTIAELLIIPNSLSISDKMMWEMTAVGSGCYSTALGSCTCFDSSSPQSKELFVLYIFWTSSYRKCGNLL